MQAFIDLAQKQLDDTIQGELKRGKISPAAASYISCLMGIVSAMPKSKGYLEDELAGSQKYLDEYRLTSDSDYLRMSQDELGHAEKFLLDLQRKDPNSKRFKDAYGQFSKLKAELASL